MLDLPDPLPDQTRRQTRSQTNRCFEFHECYSSERGLPAWRCPEFPHRHSKRFGLIDGDLVELRQRQIFSVAVVLAAVVSFVEPTVTAYNQVIGVVGSMINA